MTVTIHVGDCIDVLRTLPAESVHCVVTSPPYFNLRDYQIDGQIGLEETAEEYIAKLVQVFREVRRVLHPTGTVWLNLGDSYATGTSAGRPAYSPNGQVGANRPEAQNSVGRNGNPFGLAAKQLMMIPARVALALQADGWWIRSQVIWQKPNAMPESVTDRPTTDYECVYLLAKEARYFYDAESIKEPISDNSNYGGTYDISHDGVYKSLSSSGRTIQKPENGRNKRTVWTIPTRPFTGWTQTYRLDRVEQGVLADGMTHRVFQDCLLHGSIRRQDSRVQCDERVDDGLSRTSHTDDRHGSERQGGSAATVQNHERETQEQSSDYQDRPCSPSATDRNSQKSKTDRARQTSQHGTACAQTSDHTSYTSQSSVGSGQYHDSGESNISEGATGDNPNNQTRFHTVDKPLSRDLFGASVDSLKEDGCICEFYSRTSQKTSHFATFPPDLVEPMIRAGTSERGACPECGCQWERIVEKVGTSLPVEERHGRVGHNGQPPQISGRYWDGPTTKATDDWRPTCDHETDPIPAVCLDPFGGAGTVGLVADRLERDAILIELNESYAQMAARRIYEDAGMFADVEVLP